MYIYRHREFFVSNIDSHRQCFIIIGNKCKLQDIFASNTMASVLWPAECPRADTADNLHWRSRDIPVAWKHSGRGDICQSWVRRFIKMFTFFISHALWKRQRLSFQSVCCPPHLSSSSSSRPSTRISRTPVSHNAPSQSPLHWSPSVIKACTEVDEKTKKKWTTELSFVFNLIITICSYSPQL